MIKKKILPLILAATLTLSIGLIGCGDDNNTDNDNNNSVTDSIDDTENTVEGLWDKVTDNKMDYTATELKSELDKKGYKITETDFMHDYFTVKGKTYDINGDKLSIYEYAEDATDDMKSDINKITDNAAKINGKDVNWTTSPHIYKKGRILVIYDGNNAEVLTALKDVLGNPILG